jgi:uncharacterized protein
MNKDKQPVSNLQELSEDECLHLLAHQSYVGRVGFVRDGKPFVLPVNYVFDEGFIILRTSEGTTLSTFDGELVAFEVDDAKPMRHSGWSVLAHGTAHRVLDEAMLSRLRHGPLRSWAWSSADCWVRIPIEAISGRRIAES